MVYFWDDTVGGYCKFDQEAATLLASRQDGEMVSELWRSARDRLIRRDGHGWSVIEPEEALHILHSQHWRITPEGEAERQKLLEEIATEV